MRLLLANIWGWMIAHKRVLLYCLAGLLLLAAVLFGMDRCSSWNFASKQDKLKANVNTIIANIEARNAVIANLKEQQAVEAERVKQATAEYLDAINATDATRQETDRALSNLANAANANRGNVSVKELEEKLRGL